MAFARLFVKKIEVDPDTGDILMHLFSRPPFLAQKGKPACAETGFRIGLVAGAGFGADWDRDKVPLLSVQWVCTLAKQGTREMRRVGLTL